LEVVEHKSTELNEKNNLIKNYLDKIVSSISDLGIEFPILKVICFLFYSFDLSMQCDTTFSDFYSSIIVFIAMDSSCEDTCS